MGEEKSDLLRIISANKQIDLSVVRYKSVDKRELEVYLENKSLSDITQEEFVNQAKEVILVTGGARGVTAHCIRALAQNEPQHSFILIGRTPHPDMASSSF